MTRAVLFVFALALSACVASEEPENETPVATTAAPTAPSPSSSAMAEWREPAAYSSRSIRIVESAI